MSDIDICIFAPFVEDKTAFWRSVIAAVRDDRFDVRLFELMLLYLKMAEIEQGVVVFSRDVPGAVRVLLPPDTVQGRDARDARGAC